MAAKNDNGRLYERVAQDLTRKIAAGDYPVGARLPAERNLAAAYGVSRPTIREATIALELDGLVDVRMGSGVYVVAAHPATGMPSETDVGPFELLEARRAIESEACAMAAVRITDDELAELETLLAAMRVGDVACAEEADRQFHIVIAHATQNSAMASTVAALWDARARSPQYRLLSDKAHEAGLTPRYEEHRLVLDGLRSREADRARAAMRGHLTNVIESILKSTEVHELEEARARVAAKRRRYAG